MIARFYDMEYVFKTEIDCELATLMHGDSLNQEHFEEIMTDNNIDFWYGLDEDYA